MLKRNTSQPFALLLYFFLCALSPHAQAAAVPLEQLEKIQQYYRNLTSLSFDFRQITNSNGRTREGAGSSTFFALPQRLQVLCAGITANPANRLS